MNKIERRCQGCYKIKDREDLIKITKLNDGKIKINPTSKELGRSIYVCKNIDCINNLIKKKKIKTALKYSNQEETDKIHEKLKACLN